MNWDDEGFLISKNRYSENSLISEVYTKCHGKVSGIIFGGTSKKIKNYLQIGNKVYLNYNSKFENRIGYFKIEIQEAMSPLYFDNQQKLACISSAIYLIKILTPEFQSNTKIFDLIEKFYKILDKNDWIKNYIFWELELFKIIGYDLELQNLVDKEIVGNEVRYVSKSSVNKRIIPNFLIDDNDEKLNLSILINGLNFVGDYLDKSILRPNGLSQPFTRIHFINTLK